MKRKRYPTDLTDTQWKRLRPLLPPAKPGGRPRSVKLREVLNGILYIVRGGCAWRMMPHDLPPWSTCYDYFRKWRNDGTWERLNDRLRTQVRHQTGKQKSPSAAILDSQSVKTTEGGVRGHDVHKNVTGRKRHILVDTLGLLLAVVVTAASVQDPKGGQLVLAKVGLRFPRLRLIWADGIYRSIIGWVRWTCLAVLELVQRTSPKFQKLPHRWIVERTFAWLGRYRRLSKDYERQCETSEAVISVAMIHLMLRRLCRT
jgi:putative transposase